MIIQAKNINKSYQTTKVLKDFNLTVSSGESVAIIGSSGSGKSTLLNILGGIDRATSGNIIVCDNDLGTMNEDKLSIFRAENLGFIYQFHHLLPDFNAIENVCIPLLINQVDKKIALVRAMKILEKVGLKDKISNFPEELSGGERQRVAIARAIINNPKLILADEPTGNLDNKNAKKVLQLLLNLCQENNSSLLLVTHDENIAKKTNRIINLLDDF